MLELPKPDNISEKIDDSEPMTTIKIPVNLRDNGLKPLKIIQRESWYSVVQRLVDEHNAKKKR